MKKIGDLFEKPIDRPIEEVIKVDQANEKVVATEIDEYVVTESIREQFSTVYREIAEGPAVPREGIGVWISGFFGSGKSSFAKILGYTAANRKVGDTSASDLFKRICSDRKVIDLLDLWEIGKSRIGFKFMDRTEAAKSPFKFFPYMKGGIPIPWYGNQAYVVNYRRGGIEMVASREDGSCPGHRHDNPGWYFRKGITWTLLSQKAFAARLSPGGFVFDVNGMTCFPTEELIPTILGLLNSKIGNYQLSLINPTIAFQAGDLERIPIPIERSDRIEVLVAECVELAKQNSRESEITYDFIQSLGSLKNLTARNAELAEREEEIDREVSRLYGLTKEDLAAINRELSGASETGEGDNEEDPAEENEEESIPPMTREAWAQSWISYSVGIVLGRFEVGVPGGLGCGDFTPEAVSALKLLAAPDGILINDPGQPFDLSQRVWQALEAMLGPEEARRRVSTALGGGDSIEVLSGWFDRFTGQPGTSFWKYHFQLYRKRPVYWPLQSPKRKFTVWVFHERITSDTLFHIRNDIVEPRLRLAEREITDLRVRAESDHRARKELDQLLDFSDDLADFSKRLKEITDRGYIPHIDDGVLLNAATLHEILPSWPETKKVWEELSKGEYDWAQQAMEYWPERVKEICKTNKSFAIAHGLEELFEEKASPPKKGRKRAQ